MKRSILLVSAFVIAGALAGRASAAQITITSVTGNWHDATATSGGAGSPVITNGNPTSSINWGTQTPQSGYDYTRTIPGPQTLPPSPTPLFPLGTFTHRNRTASPSLTSVQLDVVLQLNVDGVATGPLSFTFKFNHDETANTSTFAQCDQSKTNPTSTIPCPDVVSFTASPQPTTFMVGGVDYTLSMSFVDSNGQPVAKFITEEGQNNIANLVGQFTKPATGGGSNTAPQVNAGPDQTITLPASANLSGTATDDGLPNNIMTVTWTLVSGPGNVTFGNAQSLGTTASFSAAGTYVLRLTASDTLLSTSDNITINVLGACTPNNSCQANTCLGSVCEDSCGTNYSGTKNCNVPILPPPCVPDNSCAADTCLGGTCQDSCNDSFSGTKNCNLPPPVNMPPVVNAGPDQTITLPAIATLAGAASDDGHPNNTLTHIWSKVSGPGTVTFGNVSALSTTASFSAEGTYVLQLMASDSALTASDTITITARGTPVASKIVVSPAYLSIKVGDHANFTKIVYDQYGTVMPNEAVTWSSSAGSISNAGSFVGLQPTYRVTVRATSNSNPSVTGQALLDVLDPKVAAAGDLSNAVAYPVPWKSTMNANSIYFDHLPGNTTIRLFTLDGRKVRTINVVNGGKIPWTIDNDNGERVASGVYYYIIDNADSHQHVKGKLVVIK